MDGTPPRAGRPGGVPGPVDRPGPWADPDVAFFTVGQAGDLLGVPAATLRRLDAAGAVSPARSAGGQRRYSSNQLTHARRLVDLVAEGLSLQAATRIAALEDEVEHLRGRLGEGGQT